MTSIARQLLCAPFVIFLSGCELEEESRLLRFEASDSSYSVGYTCIQGFSLWENADDQVFLDLQFTAPCSEQLAYFFAGIPEERLDISLEGSTLHTLIPVPGYSLASTVTVSVPDRRVAEGLYARLVSLEVKNSLP